MSAMKWAKHELEHIGRIVSVEDPDIQYSYAMSTLYGMLHLRKALTELVNDSAYAAQREDLQRTLDQVVRAIKHLIKDFSLDMNAIRTFNTKKILGDLADISPPVPNVAVPNVRANLNRRATPNGRATPNVRAVTNGRATPNVRANLNRRATPNVRVNNRSVASNRNTRKNKQEPSKYFFGLF